jgi:hypothetical protein
LGTPPESWHKGEPAARLTARRALDLPIVMRTTKSDLTAARLRELLGYDPATGVFTWRCSRGYRHIEVGGKRYLASRLAWLFRSAATRATTRFQLLRALVFALARPQRVRRCFASCRASSALARALPSLASSTAIVDARRRLSATWAKFTERWP